MQNKIKIDETNAKILKALLRDSRTTFTEIAKDCKLSVAAVRMRYNLLKKAGIIKGTTIEVNPSMLGYKCVADIGIITAIDNEEAVRENLKRKQIFLETERIGKYNILALVSLPTLEELGRVSEYVAADPYIEHTDTLIWAEVTNISHPENLIIEPFADKNEKKTSEKPATIGLEEVQIDATDRRIVEILSQDSRTPFKEIAEKLGFSTNVAIQRYKRLRERNVITHTAITVDLNKLGYKALANIFVKIANRSKMPEIYTKLLQIPNAINIYKLIGIYDLRIVVAVTDFEDVVNLRDQFRKMKDIDQAEITIDRIIGPWPWNLFTPLV
jgi:Lrp/AsnC family transcriptional regulator for asnA, asnC and gidA